VSLVDDIKNCPTPRDAIFLIAAAVDELRAKVEDLPNPDPWGSNWDAVPEEFTVAQADVDEFRKSEAERKEAIHAEIRQVEDKLNSAPDEEEHKALSAKLTLLRDQLRDEQYIDPTVEPKASVVERVGNEIVVNLPPADDEKKAKRRKFAEAIQLEESIEGIGPDDYAKGGPLWLYYGNRDFVKTLPSTAHQVMIADVFDDDPEEARIMSADLLKFDDVEGPEIVLGRLHGDT
jgi:hypothetical protein